MLLGFIIYEHGIEANPEKISAIMRMGPIQNIKGVQRVTGCLAALSHFISRFSGFSGMTSSYRMTRAGGLPLYRLLKKADCFEWIPEAQEALDKVK